MKFSGLRRVKAVSLVWVLASVFFVMMGSVVWAQAEQEKGFSLMGPTSQPGVSQNYSTLSSLVAMVCEEAIESFYDFFGPSQVGVNPFIVIGEFPSKKVTILGVTLADHMTAMINNNSIAQHIPEGYGEHDQTLEGVLQEMDGFLRIHMSGVNSGGERRSYVVNVEMSEPIYRALHSNVSMK